VEFRRASKGREAYGALTFPVQLTQKYGEILYLRAARQYLITGPIGFEHILKTHAQNYSKCNFFYNRMKPLFGKSLLVSDGQPWKQHRQIAQPAFQMAMIKRYAPVITNCCETFCEKMQSNTSKSKQHNLLALMSTLTLEIALKLFCGKTLPDFQMKKLGKAIHFGNWHVSHALFIKPWIPTPHNLRFYYLTHLMDRILLDLIQERRQMLASAGLLNPNPSTAISSHALTTDLLGLLITHGQENPAGMLSDDEILAEFKTLLLTGHETTACGLTWMWHLLAKYPEHLPYLERELETIIGNRTPALDDYHELPILKAILSETFRLYPPIWSMARTSQSADSIQGYPIPKNALITLNVYALHRNPRYWQNPNTFYPPRFFGENENTQHPFTYLPFSTGPRNCIASHLGMIESMLIVATIAKHLRFEYKRKTKVYPYPEPCISLRPKGGLWMQIRPR